jgi:hypothetical protein
VNAHNVANATLQTNIRALPSIAASNATVAGTPGTSQTITLAATLANYNLPSISIDTSLITSGTLTLARTTATAQSYNHQYRAGGSGMPTLSIVYYDGVSVKQYLGCSIDQLDFAFSVDKAIEIDVKAIARMETDSTTGLVWSTQTASATAITPGQQQVTMGAATDNVTTGTLCYVTNNDGSTNPEFVTVQSVATGNKLVANFTLSHDASWKLTPLKVPQLSIAAYNQPVDPQQVASITIGGVSNANLINAKITLKQNRNAFWTIQPGADMKRATEGEVSCAFDAQFDYSAYAGSQYKTYIDNTAPGAIVFTYQDTTSIAGTKVPKLVWTLPNPIITDGNLNSMSPSVAAQIKGMGALDTTTNTNLQVDLTNEEYQYITRA